MFSYTPEGGFDISGEIDPDPASLKFTFQLTSKDKGDDESADDGAGINTPAAAPASSTRIFSGTYDLLTWRVSRLSNIVLSRAPRQYSAFSQVRTCSRH